MSRQRAGWAVSRFLEKLHLAGVKKSSTAGKNKYSPQPAAMTPEAVKKLEELEEKYRKRLARKAERQYEG